MGDYINCFPGYEKVIETDAHGKKIVHNMYRGTDLGLGGYVYFEEGVYENLALLDVSNMHGLSIIALNKFADRTKIFADIREANLAIKHKNFDQLRTLMGGQLAKYIDDPNTDWKALRTALKLVSNSTYGIADATFENPLRDSRDDNNIIALRGALFMRTLQDEVANKGFTVAHIKTDSIKIPNATPEIVQFCIDFAAKYGYEFEFEAVYEKFCLVNGSTYVAKHMSTEKCKELFNYIPGENKEAEESGMMWTATAAQFQQPYVFKTLFSHEPIKFEDMCETKSVKTALYLDFNEKLDDMSDIEEALSKWDKSCKKCAALVDQRRSLIDLWAKRNQDPAIGKKIEDIQKEEAKEERVQEKQRLYLQKQLGTDLDYGPLHVFADECVAYNHNYQFVGGVGLFSPVVQGVGGGILVRSDGNGGYVAVTGTKKPDGSGVYRWMESEMVQMQHLEDKIDQSYYRYLVDEAAASISNQCSRMNELKGTSYSLDWFVS